jgi:hypothetical protein
LDEFEEVLIARWSRVGIIRLFSKPCLGWHGGARRGVYLSHHPI